MIYGKNMAIKFCSRVQFALYFQLISIIHVVMSCERSEKKSDLDYTDLFLCKVCHYRGVHIPLLKGVMPGTSLKSEINLVVSSGGGMLPRRLYDTNTSV